MKLGSTSFAELLTLGVSCVEGSLIPGFFRRIKAYILALIAPTFFAPQSRRMLLPARRLLISDYFFTEQQYCAGLPVEWSENILIEYRLTRSLEPGAEPFFSTTGPSVVGRSIDQY